MWFESRAYQKVYLSCCGVLDDVGIRFGDSQGFVLFDMIHVMSHDVVISLEC